MIKRIFTWGAFIILIALVVVYFGRNWMVERAVEAGGEYALGVETVLGSAEVNLRGGKLDLNDLEIRNPDGFGGGDLLDIKLGSVVVDAGSIFGHEVIIDTLLLDGIKVGFRQIDSKGNFLVVLDHIKNLDMGSSESDDKKIRIKQVSVQHISVAGSLTVLGKKQYERSFLIDGFNMQNVGGKDGASLGQIMASVVKEILLRAASAGSEQLSGKLGDSLSQAKKNALKNFDSGVKSKIEDLSKKLIGGDKK
jgi:hypothetical protein